MHKNMYLGKRLNVVKHKHRTDMCMISGFAAPAPNHKTTVNELGHLVYVAHFGSGRWSAGVICGTRGQELPQYQTEPAPKRT